MTDPPPITRRKGERRHLARRRTDLPPSAHQNWLVALVARNPVLTGMTLALALSAITLVLVISALTGVRTQQDRLTAFAVAQHQSRLDTVGQFCDAINTNAAVLNRQTDYLKAIILSSVSQSRPFEKVYRQFGLPDYAHRLAQAKQLAAGLEKRKVPPLDCVAYRRQVAREKP